MIGLADIYIWFLQNKWWLVCLVPFIIVILFLRSASVK